MNEKDIQKYRGHYSEEKFSGKIVKAAGKAGQKVIYPVLLLFYVLKSPAISNRDRNIILGALGYFILPLDIFPDFIPLAGFTDDLSAILLAVHAIWKNITPDVKSKAAAKARELFGDFDQEEMDRRLSEDM